MDRQEILDEIKLLENGDTNYTNCTKLAVLYSIRDNLKNNTAGYSYGSSEYLLAVSKAPTEEVYKIMDEHLECIKVLYPKEYTAVINKIKNIVY